MIEIEILQKIQRETDQYKRLLLERGHVVDPSDPVQYRSLLKMNVDQDCSPPL